MPEYDGTGPWGGNGPMTGRKQGLVKRNSGMSGLPSISSMTWTAFKAAITYGVIRFLWLGEK